ncbi:hypothetical protein XELAEV_18028210mg [Xenopus laevis]|uniref:Uncharacterized protein n=1 Tax=Xenopus laevis TaxID=8355 RepID=A0A974CZ79_XENLA|nr:hypothetical protein XELAEV_18028210mg [Xenopus laevis]
MLCHQKIWAILTLWEARGKMESNTNHLPTTDFKKKCFTHPHLQINPWIFITLKVSQKPSDNIFLAIYIDSSGLFALGQTTG